MNNGQVYFEIQADDVKRARDFYSAILGWKFSEVPGLPVEYWRIDNGGVGGGLLKRPAPRPPMQSGTNAFVCSFQVENFDVAADGVTQLGGIVALPKFAVPGRCWQGYFIDTEGNTFGVFEVDEKAGK
jgi:predicted enzyme related to lactoylglutathione lyase